MIWSYGSTIVLKNSYAIQILICKTKKTEDFETKKFWEMLRQRIFKTTKFGGCRDRDQPRLSNSCWDWDFIESLANHWQDLISWQTRTKSMKYENDHSTKNAYYINTRGHTYIYLLCYQHRLHIYVPNGNQGVIQLQRVNK